MAKQAIGYISSSPAVKQIFWNNVRETVKTLTEPVALGQEQAPHILTPTRPSAEKKCTNGHSLYS